MSDTQRKRRDYFGLGPVLRLLELRWIAFSTWGISPMSPYVARAVIRRNELETTR